MTVSEEVPPTFQFHKGYRTSVDSFPFFAIEELAPENLQRPYGQEDRDKNLVIWRIAPKPELWGSGILDRLPPIRYGDIPPGFIQEIPKEGLAPTLVEDKVYEAGGAYSLMPNAVVRFRISNDRIILLESK